MVTPVGGLLIDRVGPRTVLLWAIAAGIGGALITLSHSLPLVIIGLAIASSAVFTCQATATSHLRVASPPPLRALASGAYVTVYYVGGSLGGVLPGLLWHHGGWAGCVALVVAAQLFAATLGAVFWTRPAAATMQAAA